MTVSDSQPFGEQLAIMVDYDALFKSQVASCRFPNPFFCDALVKKRSLGFVFRFYVGASPSRGSPPTADAGPRPIGAGLR